MPITHTWYDEAQTILKIDYVDCWTWDEFFTAAANKGGALANSVNHRVDYILDMQNGSVPSGGSTLTNSRTVMAQRAANSGIFVIVTNPFVKIMLNVFKNFDRQHGAIMFAAGSPVEALAIIAKHRQKNVANV